MVFFGEKISGCEFDWKIISVSEIGRKKILLAICAYCFWKKKNNVAEKKILCAARKKFDSEKNHSPPPFKLNGCSLINLYLIWIIL